MRRRNIGIARDAALALGIGLLIGASGCTADRNPRGPASIEECESWAMSTADGHSNKPSPFLGCANKVNLLNMVDKPADLVTGRSLGPADGNREALGVEKYEQGKIAPFQRINPPSQLPMPPGPSGGE